MEIIQYIMKKVQTLYLIGWWINAILHVFTFARNGGHNGLNTRELQWVSELMKANK